MTERLHFHWVPDCFMWDLLGLRYSYKVSITVCVCVCVCVCVLVAQSCPTLCDLVDCSLPGSSVHGISQSRMLMWVATSFSRASSQPRVRTQVSSVFCIGR